MRARSPLLSALLFGLALEAVPAGAVPPDFAACWETPNGCGFPDERGKPDFPVGPPSDAPGQGPNVSAVPLPASVWLMVGGIVALGGVRGGRALRRGPTR